MSNDSTVDFAELSQRLEDGDTSALDEIWLRFGDQLRRRARTRLRQYGFMGHAESMDICNAVILDLMKQKSIKVRKPTDLIGYIRRAIDNQVLDLIRGLTRMRRDVRQVDGRPVDEHAIIQDQTSPSMVLAKNELLERIGMQLGDDGRQFLQLVMENRSWIEIGEAFDITPDNARMRWKRTLERVRAEFGATGEKP